MFWNSNYIILVRFLLDLDHVASSSCDLSGNAWPVNSWQDIIRQTTVSSCAFSIKGNGQCDIANNIASGSCSYDGGDCCMTTCLENCVSRQESQPTILGGDIAYTNPLLKKYECLGMCGVVASPGTNCPYQCLDDSYVGQGSAYTGWCSSQDGRGNQVPMSECFSTQDDITRVLRECVMDERSHGSGATASSRCGNQTMDCTLSDVISQTDGCHIHPDLCTLNNCCGLAEASGWISPSTVTDLPGKCDLAALCDADCMATMAQCVRGNKACKGGCCKCTEDLWFGPNCDQPLCWPKCRRGTCVAPNTCFCESGWSGVSCEIPVCLPNCVGGQGVCASPNVCECFYGYEGEHCELPKSTPPCINGYAAAPDVCKCDSGWGGRICDYPICQSYPVPSSDCGHGKCVKPWTCSCEPGWSLTIPVGADGIDVTPDFWNGRDATSLIPESEFVLGDSRFNQTGSFEYTFSEYNAFKCLTPSCRLIIDANCAQCGESSCTLCDQGFYLEGGRCLRCQLKFRHCRACVDDTCRLCDPLFVLVGGNCVSDGIFEFSSPKYHVMSSEKFVQIKIIRAIDSIDFEFQQRDQLVRNSLQFLVHTLPSGSALYSSSEVFSDYESSRIPVEFGPVDPNLSVPATKDECRNLLTLEQTVEIEIFDNLVYDGLPRSFSVRLIADPEAISGSTFPVRPSNSGLDDPIAQADVYIWDSSQFDYTTCEVDPAFLTSSADFTDESFTVGIRCQKCVADEPDLTGCADWEYWDSSDDFLVATTTMAGAVVSTTNGSTFDADGYMPVTGLVPVEEDNFSVTIQALYSGAIVTFFVFSGEPLPGQAPDVLRREHTVNREWASAQLTPAFLKYSGFVYFDCLSGSTVPSNLGLAVSQGGYVELQFGDLFVNNTRSADLDATDAEWQAPIEPATCSDEAGVICLDPAPTLDHADVVPFLVAFKVYSGNYLRPAGVRLMWDVDGTWSVVPEECLYAGVNIPQSPILGLTVGSAPTP